MNPIKVEVGQYRPMQEKGALKAFFSLLIVEPGQQKILDCSYFVSGDRRWFNFPSKEIKKDTGKDFIPLNSFGNKQYLAQLQEAVLIALQKEQANHESQNRSSTPRKSSQVQAKPSISDEELPF